MTIENFFCTCLETLEEDYQYIVSVAETRKDFVIEILVVIGVQRFHLVYIFTK